MKKSFVILAVMVLTLSSLTSFAQQKNWVHFCSGGGRVYFSTSGDTSAVQAGAMGEAWCNNR